MKFAQTCAMIRRSDPIRSDPIRSDSVQIRFGSNPIQSLRSDRIRSNPSGPIRSDLIPSVCFTCMSCHKTFNPRIDTATEYYMDSELNPLSNARQFNVQLNERQKTKLTYIYTYIYISTHERDFVWSTKFLEDSLCRVGSRQATRAAIKVIFAIHFSRHVRVILIYIACVCTKRSNASHCSQGQCTARKNLCASSSQYRQEFMRHQHET